MTKILPFLLTLSFSLSAFSFCNQYTLDQAKEKLRVTEAYHDAGLAPSTDILLVNIEILDQKLCIEEITDQEYCQQAKPLAVKAYEHYKAEHSVGLRSSDTGRKANGTYKMVSDYCQGIIY